MSVPQTVLVVDYSVVDALLSGWALVELLTHLDPNRYSPVVVCNRDSETAARLRAAGVRTYVVPHGGGGIGRKIREHFAFLFTVCALVRQFKPALIYANNAMAGRNALLAKPFVHLPVVVMLRNVGFLPLPRRLLLTADRFLAHTQYTIENTLPSSARPRARAVGAGLDLRRYSVPTNEQRASARRRLALPVDVLIVGMAARLTEQKGQRHFVRAAEIVCADWPNVVFVHVGKLPGQPSNTPTASEDDQVYERELQHLSASLVAAGKFFWRDYMENIRDLWSACDIGVLASSGPEALGLVVIEAMASGLPVVVTNCGGQSETVTSDVGLVVPPADPQTLSTAIARLLADPKLRGELGANGRSLVEARFSATFHAQIIMKQFDSLSGAQKVPD